MNSIRVADPPHEDYGDVSISEYRRAQRASKLELAFETQLRQLFLHRGWELLGIEREFKFDWWHGRQWRADFAIDVSVATVEDAPDHRFTDASDILLIEIEGGTRQYGRHNRHEGMTGDCYKYSAASSLGYTILRGTSQMVNDGTLLRMVEETLTDELHIEDWKTP